MRFLFLIKKELLHFLRNKGLLVFVIYLFTGDIYIAANGIDLSLKDAKFYAVDYDMSFQSRELVSKMVKPWFDFKGYLVNERLADDYLIRDKGVGVLVVPNDFSKKLKKGEFDVALYLNGADASTGYLFTSYASNIMIDYYLENVPSRERFAKVITESRILYNENALTKNFLGLSELFSVITLLVLILPAASIIREKDEGNIEMILISPLSIKRLVVAKLIAMSIVILLGTYVAVNVVLNMGLNVPVRGSIGLFLLLTLGYIFTTMGLSLFIASISENMLQVSQLAILFLLPILFLSGSWTPYESMPVIFQKMTYLSPLKYYLDAGYAVILKGLGFKFIAFDIFMMFFMGLPLFIVGTYFLMKKL
ncbi:ABC transporter permease [Deferribacter autotrophicus]|uniref:ABC transporter permease n=1 Tax=Deferribacter autotrophicus TaxID=500465 RepID=A0A5A8F1W3_9BACT|nr:ABC transporter permease [Deferribacter autotrophicus]KAA0258090.1 ABC transporter permease [Deferribacter autotrophicus]